jgi:hypothetical protein
MAKLVKRLIGCRRFSVIPIDVRLLLRAGNNPPNHRLQLGDVNRLDDVLYEAALTPLYNVLFHAIAAECNAFRSVKLLDLPHQFISGGIR